MKNPKGYIPETELSTASLESEAEVSASFSGPKTQRRTGIQLCYPFEEKRLNKWDCQVLVQPKLDGERCRAIITPEKITLLSSEGNEIQCLPHIQEELRFLGLENLEVDGELYSHTLPFEEIHSRVSRKVNPHPQAEEISLHIFDLIDENMRQAYRLTKLYNLFPASKLSGLSYIKLVPTYQARGTEDVLFHLSVFKEQNYEGIIIRHPAGFYTRRRSNQIMKFKPRKSDTYEVIGFKEEVSIQGEPKNALGALICWDDMHTRFDVGSGFTRAEREYLWEIRATLPGKKVTVKYQHLTPGRRVPRNPIYGGFSN